MIFAVNLGVALGGDISTAFFLAFAFVSFSKIKQKKKK